MNTRIARIDEKQLAAIVERATQLRAHQRGTYEVFAEVREDLRLAERQRQASEMLLAELPKAAQNRTDIERQEAKIAALRQQLAARERDLLAANEAAGAAERLAKACREFAAERGVTLPGDNPFAVSGFAAGAHL